MRVKFIRPLKPFVPGNIIECDRRVGGYLVGHHFAHRLSTVIKDTDEVVVEKPVKKVAKKKKTKKDVIDTVEKYQAKLSTRTDKK